jgi:hypothetical protein
LLCTLESQISEKKKGLGACEGTWLELESAQGLELRHDVRPLFRSQYRQLSALY